MPFSAGRIRRPVISHFPINYYSEDQFNNTHSTSHMIWSAVCVSIFLSDISFLPRPALVWCERGIQVLLTTMGAFAAFALMTVAIGTDYWLYARAFICNSTANSSQDESNNKDKKDPGALTHSGLWRICCLEGTTAANANANVCVS